MNLLFILSLMAIFQVEGTGNWEVGHGIWLITDPFNARSEAPLSIC